MNKERKLDSKQKLYISIYLDGHLPRGSVAPSQEDVDLYLEEKSLRQNFIY